MSHCVSNVLVINSGSSTIKFQVLDPGTNHVVTSGLVDRIGTPGAVVKWKQDGDQKKMVEKLAEGGATHDDHFRMGLEKIAGLTAGINLAAIGHRYNHFYSWAPISLLNLDERNFKQQI